MLQPQAKTRGSSLTARAHPLFAFSLTKLDTRKHADCKRPPETAGTDALLIRGAADMFPLLLSNFPIDWMRDAGRCLFRSAEDFHCFG